MHRLSVSVCMATYNGENFIEEQIDSILSQLSDLDELIVVDDFSKDATLKILHSYAAKDSRVKIYQNIVNLGVVKTFEAALVKSKNDIIFLSDQDDVWISGRVKCSLDIFESDSEVSGVVVNAEVLTYYDKSGISFYDDTKKHEFSLLSQLIKNKVIGCCFCFRRSVLDVALPLPTGISMHDWWLGCSALFCGKIYYFNVNKIYYRRHSSNASPSKRRSIPVVLKSRARDLRCFMQLLSRIFYRELKHEK